MTVTYTHHVASSKGFGCFWKLLFRWRGSIYKLVWPDLVIYMLLYGACSFIYRMALDADQKRVFEKVSIHCKQFADLIPVAFVLGFYVSIVVQRWWEQYMSLPWPDALALFVSTMISGQDKRSRLMRRTIMRYVNLTFVITLSMISPRVKKRFPTLDHVLDAGFLTICEKKIFDDLNLKTSHPKYWMPLVWAGAIVTRARKEGRIRDDFAVKTLVDEISKFRGLSGGLLSYDWISIPLVYTQVVTLAVYTFFLGTIMGRQFLEPQQGDAATVDLYVPWFTFLQFFFYMGWLKVAESLVNPFGEDDDDFEVNWLIDRNLQVSYLIVDEMHEEHPELIQDRYWDEVFPQELPYTVAAEPYRRMAPQGSTFNMQVPEADQEMYLMPLVEEDELVPENDHVKISMTNRHESRDSLQSSTSGIAMKSRRDSIGPRKESVVSMLFNKIMQSTQDNSNRRFSRLGSSASIRRPVRTNSRIQRTTSHESTALSHNSSRSRDGLARNPSSLHRIGSNTGRGHGSERSRREDEEGEQHSPDPMSSTAVSGRQGGGMWPAGRHYERSVSMDEDGAILIRIKPDRRTEPSLPPTTVTPRPDVARTVTCSTATTTTITSSTTSRHPPPAVAPALPSSSSAAHWPVLSTIPSSAATKDPHTTPANSCSLDSVGQIATSQDLGSDEDLDTEDPRPTNAWSACLSSSPNSDDEGAGDASGFEHTGTVRRNRKLLRPSSQLAEGNSNCGLSMGSNSVDEQRTTVPAPATLPVQAGSSASVSPDQRLRNDDSLQKALEVLKCGDENTFVPEYVPHGGPNKPVLESIQESPNNPTQNLDMKSKPAQHLMTSPSLKRAQVVSPLLSFSDEGRLVDRGAQLSTKGASTSILHASSVIPSKYFSEHSSTTMSLSSRFSDGPKSPTDSSDASLKSSNFSRKSISLEGLEEDEEGEANEEDEVIEVSPRLVVVDIERPVSAPVKPCIGHETQFGAGLSPHFTSQSHIHSDRTKLLNSTISSDDDPMGDLTPVEPDSELGEKT